MLTHGAMFKRFVLSFAAAVMLTGLFTSQVTAQEAYAYCTQTMSFDPVTWQLSSVSSMTADYDTRLWYEIYLYTEIRLGGYYPNGSVVIFTFHGNPNNDVIIYNSASTRVQANTNYVIQTEHWLNARVPLQGGGWYDPFGYVVNHQLSQTYRTYYGPQFYAYPTYQGSAIGPANGIYLGSSTNGTYTTPPYQGSATIDAVGFKGDVLLYKWSSFPSIVAIDPSDDGSPTWTRDGGVSEPVAYTLESPNNQMTIKASITLGQTLPSNAKANIRAKSRLENPGAIIASINNVPLTYPVTTISSIPGNLTVFPSYAHVGSILEELIWEISFDNGASWQPMGYSSHTFYIIFRNPDRLITPDAVFRNVQDEDFPLLYDYAVQVGVEAAYGQNDKGEAMSALTNNIYSNTTYDPSRVANGHPLAYYGRTCLCDGFANLLRGLARSIGIDALTTYQWGGDPDTGHSNWFAYYNPSDTKKVATMKIQRPQHRDNSLFNPLPKNPYFYYHAVTKWVRATEEDKYYDSAYGMTDPSLDLLRSISYSPSLTCNSTGNGNLNRVLSPSRKTGGYLNSNPPGAVSSNGGVNDSVITAICNIFNDVVPGSQFYDDIMKIAEKEVTLGCGLESYCPDALVTRGQMAAFIIRALGMPNPPTPTQPRFLDVPPSNIFYAFIEQMAVRGITVGCGGGNYCPDSGITHAQMAAFIERAVGRPNPEPPLTPTLCDVDPSNMFYALIEDYYSRGIWPGCGGNGTCSGAVYCSPTRKCFCPDAIVTRREMAHILVKGFNL